MKIRYQIDQQRAVLAGVIHGSACSAGRDVLAAGRRDW